MVCSIGTESINFLAGSGYKDSCGPNPFCSFLLAVLPTLQTHHPSSFTHSHDLAFAFSPGLTPFPLPPAALPSKPFTHRLLLLHLSRHAVSPRSDSADRAAPTDSCFLTPPTPLVGTARRSRRSLANVLLLTITLLCMPCIFAQHCSPFIERALLVAEASPRCQCRLCRTLPVIHTHTLAHTPTPYLKMSPLPQM